MPVLQSAAVAIPLQPAKTHGLADLGVPLGEATVVKKGKLGEFAQLLDEGRPGRRFQNVKVTAVRAEEGGQVAAQLIVSFEVFGDDNVPHGGNSGVQAALTAGGQVLAELQLGRLFMPYACCWYENRFVAPVPVSLFDQADGLSLQALADDVRML